MKICQGKFLFLVVALFAVGLCWMIFMKRPVVQEIHNTIIRKFSAEATVQKNNNAYPAWISSYLPNKMTDFRDADLDTLYNIYFSYADAIETFCSRKVRLGRLKDGGWDVCDDVEYQPTKPCLIYSFGIAGDWSFDDDAERLYGCEIHSFDPSINVTKPQRSKLILYHKIGLSDSDSTNDKGWQMMTLASIKKKLGHENKIIDVLKMDIEAHEWKALPQSIADSSLNQVRQLDVEFHIGASRADIIRGIETFLKIYNLGFRKYFAHKNIHTGVKWKAYKGTLTACAELHYLNMRVSH